MRVIEVPTVTNDMLKANYGVAIVTERLGRHCLVRPVAADTDIGIDLYCETVVENQPFLYFWVQVKTGTECKVDQSSNRASYRFKASHLSYWIQQPVPVFAALVPTQWPVSSEPDIYLVDVTTQMLITSIDEGQSTVALWSDYYMPVASPNAVQEFIEKRVPETTARLQIAKGVVSSIPELRAEYVHKTPFSPVSRFKNQILNQIRTTAACSVLFFLQDENPTNGNGDFRRTLAAILELFDGDPHWENYMARAVSHHLDGSYDLAAQMYQKACNTIAADPNVQDRPYWKTLKEKIMSMSDVARSKRPLG
jgi:Domain of unknown function (DUF4365)